MLFITEGHRDVVVRNAKTQFSPKTGEKIGTTRRVSAEFIAGGIPDWALEKIKGKFEFRGKPDGVDVRQWLHVYDSVTDQIVSKWTDDERAAIEQKLLSHHDVVLVEQDRTPAPWGAYPKLVAQGRRTIDMVVEKIVETVTDLELDPQAVLRFERENLNRPEVVDAVEALTAPAETVEEVVAA